MLLKPLVAAWYSWRRSRSMIVSPSAERNKQPIAEVLARYEPFASGAEARCLEIASGSGRAPPYGDLAAVFASIEAHAHGLDNVLEPLALDAAADRGAAGAFDAVVCCNVMHIAPWAVAEGILRGSAAAGATLFAYGPFAVGGAHVSESNEAFDARLRAQDEAWGVRDTADVAARAEAHGYALADVVPMPANNRLLVFTR
ncbi:DUF938-like protein [Aureococcus anophagefferens]|nr:DUF938-like protein [Aureococcus anophagefferens]